MLVGVVVGIELLVLQLGCGVDEWCYWYCRLKGGMIKCEECINGIVANTVNTYQAKSCVIERIAFILGITSGFVVRMVLAPISGR